MSDSERTDELDNYGVRIKKDGDSAHSDTADAALNDFSQDAELPDLASFDDVIADGTETSIEEDISLEEFIAGGEFEDVAEGNRGYGQAEAPAAPAATSSESVALDDFLDLSSLDDAPAAEETATASAADDAPLDIDLSFDDGDMFVTEATTPSITEETVTEPTDAASAGTEFVDLGAFGFDDGTVSDSETTVPDEPAAAEPSADSFDDMFNALDNGGTLDASAFFDDEPAASPAPAESTPPAEPAAASGEETVDLSDFGFDDDSTENQGGVKDGTKKTGGQEDYEMTVTVDDDSAQPVAVPQESAPAPADQNAPADNDFELDELMNNVTDENGNTVQISAETAPAASEAETAEPPAAQPAAPAEPNPAATALLSKIVGELDALRSEIAQLKNDFAEMKHKGIPEPATQPEPTAQVNPCDTPEPSPAEPTVMDANDFFDSAETGIFSSFAAEPDNNSGADAVQDDSEDDMTAAAAQNEAVEEAPVATEPAEETATDTVPEIPAPEQTETETGGFFDDNSDDEIISLSTDELSNILNNAEVQTETVEAEMVAEPIEETSEDDFAFDTLEQDEASDLPEEISVPKTDETAEPAETCGEPPVDTVPPAESDHATTAENQPEAAPTDEKTGDTANEISGNLKQEIKSVLSYMDQLLENLPEDKITEFAHSEQFEAYKKLFKDLGLA